MHRFALFLLLVGCTDAPDDATSEDALSRPVVLGLHDGAINHCDNFERWQPGPPNLSAAGEDMGNAAWWVPLDVGTVRVSVPWDIALPASSSAALVTAHDPAGAWATAHATALRDEQLCFDAWLAAATAAHETVDIAFKPDYDYRDPSTNHILVPDIDTYRISIAAFVAQYRNDVHIITPWGEPDYGNPHYPKSSSDRARDCSDGCEGNALPAAGITRAKEVFFLPAGSSPMDPHRARFDDPNCSSERDSTCGPVLAAQMWMAVFHECPSCVLESGASAGEPGSGIVAGDFSGGGGLDGYLALYAQHLDNCDGCAGTRPPTWALHPYPDTSNEEWCAHNTGHDFDPGADGGSNSVTVRFLDALTRAGYHEHTSVWLDEISVFAQDNYVHSSTHPPKATNGRHCGINSSTTKPTYSPQTEARALRWLVHTLPHVRGTVSPGREPIVSRIYYFRSFAGRDPDGDNITPTNATANQQALYDAIVHR